MLKLMGKEIITVLPLIILLSKRMMNTYFPGQYSIRLCGLCNGEVGR